jgi:hypothetical protein
VIPSGDKKDITKLFINFSHVQTLINNGSVIPSGDKKVGKQYLNVLAKTESIIGKKSSVIPSGDKKVEND